MGIEELTLIAGGVAALVAAVAYGVRRITLRQAQDIATALTPKALEPFVLQAVQVAYPAVEQWAKKTGELSNDARLEQALKYITALVSFYRYNNPDPVALEALMEAEVYQQNRIKAVTKALSTPAPVVPAPEVRAPETLPEDKALEAVH